MVPAALYMLAVLTVQQPESVAVFRAPVQHPTFSSTGRLAFDLNGDLWVWDGIGEHTVSGARPHRATIGPSWDRQPAWTPDGSALVFSSDRAGQFDLWRIDIGPDGTPGSLRPLGVLNSAAEPEGEPTVGPDGTIVFVRGSGPTADLWISDPTGFVRQLTQRAGGEHTPTFSPDGAEVAYVAERRGRRALRVRTLETDQDTVIIGDAGVESPAWSPRGDRIAYTVRGRHNGVWVTPRDGRYRNIVAEVRAVAAWTADGRHLALAELPGADPSYNGDPHRIADRTAGDILPAAGRLWLVDAPPAVVSRSEPEVVVSPTGNLEAYNGEAFDRVWNRLGELYFRDAGHDEWERIRAKYRPRALSATSGRELEEVVYDMLRARPTIRPEKQGRAAVSSAHPLATAAGIEMLSLGGNVVDAAVAVSFALGVVEPDASGVGGYGEMVVFLQGMPEPLVIEFLTRVPERASLSNAGLLRNGRLPADGPILANVPGTVAGMWKAFKEHGSGNLEWSRLIQPAIRLAEQGFVLDEAFPTTLARERDRFLQYEGSKALFFPGGEPLQPGDTLRNPDLAWTLRQIAAGGADAFYHGEIARRMVTDLRGQGNAVSANDLSRYFAAERAPVTGTYRGHTVYSAAPAVSGGASLIAKLQLLENVPDLELYAEHAASLHAMIEAWKIMPSSRELIADPGLWPVNLEPLVSKDSARARWQRCFHPTRSIGPAELNRNAAGQTACDQVEVAMSGGEEPESCGSDACPAAGTTAFVVADGAGNLVSVTQTLGTWGGNFYVTPGLGFLYNDKLRSYSTNPSDYNARLPFARNSTSIAPTLVFKGLGDDQRPFLAVAAAGNAWITAAVYQVLSGIVDGGLGPQQALELPRFLVNVRREPDNRRVVRKVLVQFEDGMAPGVVRELEAMGHELQRISLKGELRMGYGAAVVVDHGGVRAGADPRRSGAAQAIR